MLRERDWDAVINCHPDKWWTAICCPAPTRIALYPSPTLPAVTPRLYTHSVPDPRPPIHATRHYLQATQILDCPDPTGDSLRLTLGETPEEETFWRTFSQGDETPFAALIPFTTADNKCWEPERFAELADELAARYGLRCLLPHSPKDEAAALRIVACAKNFSPSRSD